MLIFGSGGFRDVCQLVKRLNVQKNTGYLFFQNPPVLKISTFSLGQKGCAYYDCAYYERAQYHKSHFAVSANSNTYL